MLIDVAQNDMGEAKKKLDLQKANQEEELHKKLSERKKKRLEEQVRIEPDLGQICSMVMV